MRRVRAAWVYTLLGLPKQVSDISPTQYDIRSLLKAAWTLNNDEPFVGERLLHRLLDPTYFAHILPPLPKTGASRLPEVEEDLGDLLGKGGAALNGASTWLTQFLHSLGSKDT